MFLKDSEDGDEQLLTAEESTELARIQRDSQVIGYSVMALDGTEIESGGALSDTIAPIFANAFDLADKIGAEFGEEDTCPVLFMESDEIEVAGLLLSAARAVIVKRKHKNQSEGLRSVG
jgi:hypothetical protein